MEELFSPEDANLSVVISREGGPVIRKSYFHINDNHNASAAIAYTVNRYSDDICPNTRIDCYKIKYTDVMLKEY